VAAALGEGCAAADAEMRGLGLGHACCEVLASEV
jgi:hypothetical protein